MDLYTCIIVFYLCASFSGDWTYLWLRKVEKVPTKSIFENSLTFQAPSLLKRTWKIPVIWPHLHCVEIVQKWSIFWTAFSLIRTEYGDLLRSFSYSDWIRKFTPEKYGPEKTPYLDIFHKVLVLTQLTLLNWLPVALGKIWVYGIFQEQEKGFFDIIKWRQNFLDISKVKNFHLMAEDNHTKFRPDWMRYSAFTASERMFTILLYFWNL